MTKKKAKKPKKNTSLARLDVDETAISRVSPSGALQPSERQSVREALDGSLDPKQRVMHGMLGAFQAAANLLSPYFTVTSSFSDYGGTPGQGIFGSGGAEMRDVNPRTPDTDTLVEVLCSAAAWLAKSKGIPKAALLSNFKRWAEDQGYESEE